MGFGDLVFSGFFVRQPVFTAILTLLFIITKLMALGVLPITRCPSVAPPAIRIDTMCPNTGTRAMTRAINVPVRRRMGNISKVLCVDSGSSTSNTCSLAIAFRIKASVSVTAIVMRGHIDMTLGSLPRTIGMRKIAIRGRSSGVIVVLALDNSDVCSNLCLAGCTGLGLMSRLAHMPKMKTISIVKTNSCSVHM